MAKTASSVLDLESFVSKVAHLYRNGRALGEAVTHIYKRHEIDHALLTEATLRGLSDIAAHHLTRGVRDSILNGRRRFLSVRSEPHQAGVTAITFRSELRDWPISTVAGKRRLEECTPDEVAEEIAHLDTTMRGLANRKALLVATRRAAISAGVSVIGELTDEALNAILGRN